MSDANSDNNTEAWWKTPWQTLQAEALAGTLAHAEDAVANAFNNWQQLQQQAQKQIVREWQFDPEAAPFVSHHVFLTELNKEISQRADVQEAWQCFVQALQERQRAFAAWIEAVSSETCDWWGSNDGVLETAPRASVIVG